jgi:MSHA pilin protein MshA
MNSIKRAAQAGFTLIELIVVIVILGILAATALPKFVSFSGDARLASITAAKGALSATASMVKGRYVIEGGKNTTTTVEGTVVTYVAGNGYPVGNGFFATAAGLGTADYTMYGPAAVTATTTQPGVALGELVFVPAGIAGTVAAVKCSVKYAPPAANSSAAPTITVATTLASDC